MSRQTVSYLIALAVAILARRAGVPLTDPAAAMQIAAVIGGYLFGTATPVCRFDIRWCCDFVPKGQCRFASTPTCGEIIGCPHRKVKSA